MTLSENIIDIQTGAVFIDLEKKLSEQKPTRDGSGNPPYDGGMEQRVAALEGFASDAKEKLARIETKLEHIEKEVSNFKWWVVAQIAAGFIAVIGTGVAIQQMTVATFQAAGAQASPPQPAQAPIIINVPASQPAAAPAPASAPAK